MLRYKSEAYIWFIADFTAKPSPSTSKHQIKLHIDYGNQPEYKLGQIESETAEVSLRVTRMVLNKKDRSELK